MLPIDSDTPCITTGYRSAIWSRESGLYVLTETVFRFDHADAHAGLDDTMTARGIFAWDESAGVYRIWSFGSSGQVATGTMTYDQATRTWQANDQWVNLRTGARGTGQGSMHYLNEDYKEIAWTSRSAEDQGAGFEVRGSSRRVSRNP